MRRRKHCQRKAADGPVFQEAFQGSILFTSPLYLLKFSIYPEILQTQKLMLSAPNLILLSYTARADLLETGFLMCYGTGSGRGYSLMEAESTHRHNLHILSLGAPQLGMSGHTRWRLPGELGVSARGIR